MNDNRKSMGTLKDGVLISVILQEFVAKIPWRSNIVLMDKLPDEQTRLWYARWLIEDGWSSNVLDTMIATRLIERQGKISIAGKHQT
jgi:predicted nuclease of restriction endonuclease-like (RecB) superfamily